MSLFAQRNFLSNVTPQLHSVDALAQTTLQDSTPGQHDTDNKETAASPMHALGATNSQSHPISNTPLLATVTKY
jgi:hypothetical protein